MDNSIIGFPYPLGSDLSGEWHYPTFEQAGPDVLIFVRTEKSFAHEHCKAANFLYFLLTYFGDKFVHALNPCIVEHIALEVQFYPWVP